jgi:hypothetical protein
MHTHFASGTHAVGTFLSVLIVGSFWRLAWMHAAQSKNPTVQALAGAALFQF